MGSKDVKSIVETLSNRIEILEGRSIEETERLLNIARVLEKSKDKDLELWSIYNTKIMGLEERLEEGIANDTSFRQIEAMKLELEALKELSLRLKSCCKNRMEEFSDEHLEKRIETLLADYLGTTVSKQRLAKAVQSLMAADVERHPVTSFEKTTGRSDIVTVDLVHRIVKNTLKTYDADKTGLVDYALESAGGQIISTRCTQKYDINTRVFKILALTFYHENNNPRTVIQGNPIQPGACWAFQGFPGYLLIKLRSFIYVTGFTLEHAPKSILPNGEMGSAPRKFNAWGFTDENDPEPVLFGDYEFIASDDNLQYFPVQNATITTPYEYVELRVHSNHGQLDYTCLYRFRVHGKPV